MKKNSRRLLLAACCLWLAWLPTMVSAGDSENSTLQFNQAWIRAMPPGMKMTAGLGQLLNQGDEEILLV